MTSLASIGKNDLEIILADSMEKAGRSFAGLPDPTESQQALKAQLDKIVENIKKANNK